MAPSRMSTEAEKTKNRRTKALMLVSKQVARLVDNGVVSKHPILMEDGSSQSRNTVKVFSASENDIL